MAKDAGKNTDDVGFKPLYLQVRERLIAQMIEGKWPPGQPLPSEFQLADQMKVSQGTVRKALDAMTAEKMLVRRQGRGTFVAEHDQNRIMFQFFKLQPDTGEASFPSASDLNLSKITASQAVAGALNLANTAEVWLFERCRSIGDEKVTIGEEISLDAKRFAALQDYSPLPNNIYALLEQKFGVTIAKADEKIKAVAATKRIAEKLGCPVNTPILRVERVAVALDGAPIEHRLSYCLTDSFHYLSELH